MRPEGARIRDDVSAPSVAHPKPRTRKSGRRVTRTDHMARMRARLSGRELEICAEWLHRSYMRIREASARFWRDWNAALVAILKPTADNAAFEALAPKGDHE